MDLAHILANAPQDSTFYACGPAGLLNAFINQGTTQKIGQDRIRFERFVSSVADDAKAVTVKLVRSDKVLQVAADQTILDALLDAGIPAPFSCKTGVCKTCAVAVVEGTAEHRDTALSEAEKTDHKLMCPCISRSSTEHLTLDI